MSICCACDDDILTVHPGQDADVTVTLFVDETGLPFDLTGISVGGGDEITYRFLKSREAGGGVIEKTLSGSDVVVVSEAGGRTTASLTPTDTVDLETSDKQDFEIVILFGGKTYIAKIKQKLVVEPRIDD